MVSLMPSHYDLGPSPRPPVVRFTYADGTISADYFVTTPVLEVPDGVLSVEIRQLPVYPQDFPAGDDPRWLHKDGATMARSGPPVAHAEVRGAARFQGARPGR